LIDRFLTIGMSKAKMERFSWGGGGGLRVIQNG
jgi:hypothetical protein